RHLNATGRATISSANWRRGSSRRLLFSGTGRWRRASGRPQDENEMDNTSSAKKATRKIARRTEVNKARRSRLRTFVGKVEDAIEAGDRDKALAALKEAEPIIMRSAQKGVLHRNSASRKVSRLTDRVGKLGKQAA